MCSFSLPFCWFIVMIRLHIVLFVYATLLFFGYGLCAGARVGRVESGLGWAEWAGFYSLL